MKLRWLELEVETTITHNAGSRKYPRIEERVETSTETKLQCFNESLGEWVDVPTEYHHTTRSRDLT